MTSIAPRNLYSQVLQDVLKQRLEALTKREPLLNPAVENPTILLNKILGSEGHRNQREWIIRALMLLKNAQSQSPHTELPQLIAQALEIWPSGKPFSEKLSLINGVGDYLEDNLMTAIGINAALRRISASLPPVPLPLPPQEPPLSSVEMPIFPPLPEGGLPILRQLIATVPKEGEVESYIRNFLNNQRYPMVAARMQMDRSLGRVLEINEAFAKKLEWEGKENDLKKLEIRDLFLKERALSIIMKIMGLIGTGGEYTPDEIYFLRGDGKFWRCTGAGIITGFVMKKWPGGPYGFGIFSNFTEIVSPR